MVYLIHFERAYRHARHYIGFVADKRNLQRRIEHHRAGRGARLLKAVADSNIAFDVVRTWPDGDRTFERRLKNRKETPRLCPVCNPV